MNTDPGDARSRAKEFNEVTIAVWKILEAEFAAGSLHLCFPPEVSFGGLVLGAILIILEAFDLEDHCRAINESNQIIRHVGMTHAEVFVRNCEFQMIVSRVEGAAG